jgi:hypothetical protein
MGSMSASAIQSEMEKVEQAMVNIFGRKPAYVRPPYLETGGSFLSVMRQMNYTVINDDVDTGDWNNQSPAQSEQKFQSAGAGGQGHIPLMHETYQTTVTTLTTWLINWAKTNNLKIVTVGTLKTLRSLNFFFPLSFAVFILLSHLFLLDSGSLTPLGIGTSLTWCFLLCCSRVPRRHCWHVQAGHLHWKWREQLLDGQAISEGERLFPPPFFHLDILVAGILPLPAVYTYMI